MINILTENLNSGWFVYFLMKFEFFSSIQLKTKLKTFENKHYN